MPDPMEFDYVIVGGGTAGLVVANHLSEDRNVTVAVIEAGSDATKDPRVAVPALFTAASRSELSWAFATVPQEGLNGRRIGHAQGKVLGGTSAINAQVLNPPSAFDLNAWDDLVGNEGWGRILAPYLEKSFSLSLPEEETVEHLKISWAKSFADAAVGPITASFADVKENPIGNAWVETIERLGHPLSASPFCGHSTGPYNAASTIDPVTKTRSYSNIAYYQPIKDRSNLEVFLSSIARKLLLTPNHEGQEPLVTGVEFVRDGVTTIVRANKEVVLSAGVFNTPKILELSGIGDPNILRTASIGVVVANPYVGTNLQDHVLSGISFEAQHGIFTGDGLMRQEPEVVQWARDLYQEHKAGPLCSTGITSFGYLPTVDFISNIDARDSVLRELDNTRIAKSHPLDSARISLLKRLLEKGDEGTAQYFLFPAQSSSAGRDTTSGLESGPQPGSFITLVSALSHPLSTGTSHISSSDPDAPPVIDNKYLANPIDLELHARHVRYLERIASSAPFSTTILKEDGKRNHPAAFLDDDLQKAKEWVKMASTTNWHSVGTCAMAPKHKGGVVDHKLRVYGVGNLRVVDASVFPLIPQSNTQSLVYMVAERASDIMKEDQ